MIMAMLGTIIKKNGTFSRYYRLECRLDVVSIPETKMT